MSLSVTLRIYAFGILLQAYLCSGCQDLQPGDMQNRHTKSSGFTSFSVVTDDGRGLYGPYS